MGQGRVCVFCNKKPIGKNREHVIPQWLIKMTGKENRQILIRGVGSENSYNKFDVKSFTFPACSACNNKYSELENKVKYCVSKLVNRDAVSAGELETVMDWLDKVRIGLFLGSVMYSKNPLNINAKFGIDARPRKDRALVICLTDKIYERLNFTSFDDPLFHIIPCFFGILINGLYLFSVSSDTLLSNEVPLPGLIVTSQDDMGNLTVKLAESTNDEISVPFMGRRYTTIIQANYPKKVADTYFKNSQMEYMNKNMIRSKIIIIRNRKLVCYPNKPSYNWKPVEYPPIQLENFLEINDKKFLRLRNWVAMKSLGESPNKDIKRFYKNLVLGNVVQQHF